MAHTRRGLFDLFAGGLGLCVVANPFTRLLAADFHGFVPIVANPEWDTSSFTAHDGTRLVYHVMGSGQPLVIVHGGASNAEAYYKAAQLLKDRFKMYLLERRNYFISGDGPKSYQAEARDVHALLDIAGPGAHLFGHSAGALVSLCAGLDHHGVNRTVLYEPPLLSAGDRVRPILADFRARCASDACRDAIADDFHLIAGDPLERGKQLADRIFALDPESRRRMLSILETELISLVQLDPDPKHYRKIARPVTFLTGDQSAEMPLRASVAALHAVMPDTNVITLKGQGHIANALAPQMFADALASALA